jgi:hypothetical protein
MSFRRQGGVSVEKAAMGNINHQAAAGGDFGQKADWKSPAGGVEGFQAASLFETIEQRP